MNKVIADRFVLGRRIGVGGMGEVWHAEDRHTGEHIALKLLKGTDALDVTRFERESALLAAFEHPGIVRYIAHGMGSEQPWLAMEWLEGHTLGDALLRGPMPFDSALDVVRQVAEALTEPHARGIVHRDLKPANLFVLEDGRIKVLDFGIARSIASGHTLTSTGTAIGTPHYMSPEQARADRGLDASTDVYALGCVLYEAIAGVRAFEGDSPIAVLAKILLEEPRPLVVHCPEIPPEVESLVRRMLDKEPSARPGNGEFLARAIADLGPLRPSRRPQSIAPALGEQEQRLVCVVMVADVGFHAASAPTLLSTDEIGDRDMHEQLRELAEAHGGQVDVLADGSMLATIAGRGLPTDQAERAARFALSLRDVFPNAPIALVAGRSVLTSRLPAGSVIDRGVAALDAVSSGEGRMPVAIDDIIDGLLDDRFIRDGDPGTRWLRSHRPIEVPRRTLLGVRVPCVGRRRELATLAAIVEESWSEPVARAVLVRAPAGAGKTRVIQELLEQIAGDEFPDVSLLVGRADPMRAGSPYATLASAVRMAAGIVDAEPLDVQRRKLAARVAEVSEGSDRSRITTFLGELVRVPFAGKGLPALEAARRDPQLMGDAVRAALEDWMALECARKPVFLLLEDLHWADRPTIAAVDGLLRHLEEQPLVVVATARPAIDRAHPALWSERDLQEVRLARLTKRAAAKLVRAALGDVPDEVVTPIVERADGNAFFLEELVRAHARGEHQALPDTVLGMVEARLSSLDPAARRTLRAASVFGARFWTRGVEHLVGKAREGRTAASHWLASFARDELILPSETSALAGEEQWRFRQALVRDAAYAMLTDEDRTLGHRLAAKWLEAKGERDPRVLARHHQLGEDATTAAGWHARAAAQALAANDYAAALEAAREGETAEAISPLLRGELTLLRAEAHRWRGEHESALQAAEIATGHLAAGSARWFKAVGNVIVAAGICGRHELAQRHAELAMATPPLQKEDDADRLVCLCRATHQAMGVEDDERAAKLMSEVDRVAHAILSDRVDPVTEAWLHTTHAARALKVGAISDYLEGTEAAIRAYDLAGDRRYACNQRVRLGFGLIEIGELPRAEDELRVALAAAERLHVPLVQGYALQNLGWVRALRDDATEGRAHQRAAVELGKRLDDPAVEGGARFYLSRIALGVGDLDEALGEARKAADRVAAIAPLHALCLAALSQAQLALDFTAEALISARQAAAYLETLSLEGAELLVWLALLQALRGAGEDCGQAREHAEQALDERLQGMRPEHRSSFLATGDAARLRATLTG